MPCKGGVGRGAFWRAPDRWNLSGSVGDLQGCLTCRARPLTGRSALAMDWPPSMALRSLSPGSTAVLLPGFPSYKQSLKPLLGGDRLVASLEGLVDGENGLSPPSCALTTTCLCRLPISYPVAFCMDVRPLPNAQRAGRRKQTQARAKCPCVHVSSPVF